MDSGPGSQRYRFGTFEFDAAVQELRRSGRRVRLRPQSLKLLALLLSRPGELVSREEIQGALWGHDTFVDFEQGVNHCIKQLRAALRDSADSPRFIETLPRRGYRFIAPVETLAAGDSARPQRSDIEEIVEVLRSAQDAADRGEGAKYAARVGRPPKYVLNAGPISHPSYRSPAAIAIAVVLAVTATGMLSTLYLGRPRAASPGVPPTLLVVPFSATGTEATVGVGLANAISTRLAGQRLAPVRAGRAPETDSATASASAVDRGRAAGATLVLTGQLSQTGDAITVLTQLTDVASGESTWTGRFQVRVDELFSVEDVIAERVVGALALRVAAAEQERLRRRYTSNAAAYDSYLRGRAALVEYTPEGTRRAVDAFEAALRQDPGYALARAGLAMACADMYLRFARSEDVDRWGTCAESEARAAIDVDPDLAEAHLARAAVARKREFDWSAAIAASQRAVVLNPNLDQAHFFAAAGYYHLGYMEEALIEMARGRRLRGADVIEPLRIEALVALFSGNFGAARVHLEEVSRRSSQAIGDTYLALAYYYSGNVDRGRPMLESLASSSSASTATRAGAALAGVLAAQGDREAARAAIARVLAREYRDHHVAYSLGAAYAQLGDIDEATRWLGTAADTGFPCLIWFERDPLLEPIRRHAAFAQTLERVRAQRQSALSRLGAIGQ